MEFPRLKHGMVSAPLQVLLWYVLLAPTAEEKFTGPNMNGEYEISFTPKQSSGKWSTNFKDYPGGVEYFETYSGPVKSTYGEVFWTALPSVALPAELIKRFHGKGMAVVGFEADQVRRTSEGDVSVPINVAYNHHYGVTLTGEGSRMQRLRRDHHDPRTMSRGCGGLTNDPDYVWVPVEHIPSANGLPTSMQYGYANGGEFQKSYHGLAPPFAQIVESPNQVHVYPMQIDTWNRDKMNLTGGAFVPGPQPKSARAPVTGPDAVYSGLLECPLTTRIRKRTTATWNASYVAQIFSCTKPQRCQTAPSKAEACFAAANELSGLEGMSISEGQGLSATLPAGCTVSVNGEGASVFFNTNDTSTACCGSGADTIRGGQTSLVKLELALSLSHGATITMTGPDGVWFGVGFDAASMSNSPYAVVVDGSGRVTEHVLGKNAPGVQITASVEVLSSSVTAGKRKVVLQRPLKGLTPQHHNFDARKMSLNFIDAIGSGPHFSYHKFKAASDISMWPVSTPACLCIVPAVPFGHGDGIIEYMPNGDTVGFTTSCREGESILANRNPTCDIRTYEGGLQVCHHTWHLLDADQEVPWQDQPLEYWMKFRMYFQEYDPKHHISALYGPGWTQWSIGANTAEYDVPECAPDTPDRSKCTHEITGTVTIPGTDLHMVAGHFHCHAPTCLALEVYDNKTGELICRETPYHGQGTDLKPGGNPYDQKGYISQPPCLWGNPPFERPPLLSGKTLFIKAITNSTYRHLGEMALPQVLLASMPINEFLI